MLTTKLLLFTQLTSVLAYVIRAQTATELGTFRNPAAKARPFFRYWLPDPGVDKDVVASNIKAAGSHGAGGTEFLAFYNYGGAIPAEPAGADWVENGFGTPAFRDMFRVALEAHRDAGLRMDFPLGPNQGQGVPARADDEGLQWDLAPFYINVSANSFQGQIPGWGTGELVAVVSARVLQEVNVTIPTTGPGLIPPQSSYLSLILDYESLSDLTNQVSSNGQLSVSFPSSSTDDRHQIFIYYQTRTLHQNLIVSSNATSTIWDNGSYAVDHYSAKGAQTVIRFWEEYILIDGLKELLMEVGNYGWEDSVELTSNTSWTPSLPANFEQKFGYSIRKYLPLIIFGPLGANNNINIQSGSPGLIKSVLNTPDLGVGYINDYRSVLVDGYREYLQTLTNWTHESLNLQFSAQVSYNLPMDALANVPFVDAPEDESLQFNDNLDGYRQYEGPAHLSGKRVISNEIGAIFGEAYRYPIPRLLFSVARAVAGGVNRFVLHGQSYTGNYYGTTWPGYTAFSYLFSEMYSEKQPAWDNGFSETLDYIARLQYVQQQGVPRTDLAVYNKASATNPGFSTIFQPQDLADEGWSWSHISPDNFLLPEARVVDRVLGPEGPRFKALIIPQSSKMTLDGVQYIQTYADHGLPIIFSGGLPGPYLAGNVDVSGDIESRLSTLVASENAYLVDEGDLAIKLNSLGLAPNVRTQTNGTWWTTWREDSSSGVSYAFIFCDTNSSYGEITITGSANTNQPYRLNAWTGEIEPIFTYNVTDAGITIPASLAGNQTMIIAVAERPLSKTAHPRIHAVETPPSVLGSILHKGRSWIAQVAYPATGQQSNDIVLSNGKTVALPDTSRIAQPFKLQNWNLTAEHWEAPTDINDASIIARKYNTTHELTTLVSWTDIPALVNTSGLGYYRTTFQWPPQQESGTGADGAYIHFPSILQAIRVSINGRMLPPLDYANAKADIGPYLQRGTNEVLAVVPTVMWNYLRSIFSEIKDQGQPPLLAYLSGDNLPPLSHNGLVGEVTVTPYVNVTIR